MLKKNKAKNCQLEKLKTDMNLSLQSNMCSFCMYVCKEACRKWIKTIIKI